MTVGEKLEFAKIALGLIFIVLSFAIGWSWASEYQEIHYNASENSRQIANMTALRIERECTQAAVGDLRNCIEAIVADAREGQLDEQDLAAQKEMAWWALWMAIASAVSCLVSVGALFGLFWSLRQTQTAIRDNREIGELQTVAHLTNEPLTLNISFNQSPPRALISGRWVNIGHTPAETAVAVFTLHISAGDSNVIEVSAVANEEVGAVAIGPAGENFHACIDVPELESHLGELQAKNFACGLTVQWSYRTCFKGRKPEERKEIYVSSAIFGGETEWKVKMGRVALDQASDIFAKVGRV